MGKSVVEKKQLNQDSKVRASGPVGIGKGEDPMFSGEVLVIKRALSHSLLDPGYSHRAGGFTQNWWHMAKVMRTS